MVTGQRPSLVLLDGGAPAGGRDVAAGPVGTAIFPLGPRTSDDDPLRALLSATGSLALSWTERERGHWAVRQALAPGAAASALSGMAMAARLGNPGRAGTLYRAIIPAGQQLLASSKVAGGFIGATTAAGAKGFAGAAVFVPATLSAAPVLAMVGLVVVGAGLAWAAERDQLRRHEEITSALAGIRRELDLDRVSGLQGAEHALHQAELVLLDDPTADVERVVPGFGGAAAEVRKARARARTEVARMGQVADEAGSKDRVKESWLFSSERLGGKSADGSRFLLSALETDRALAAHQRLVALQDTLVRAAEARDLALPRVLESLRADMTDDEHLRLELRSICYALPRVRLDSVDAMRLLLEVPDALGSVVSPLTTILDEPAALTYRIRADGGVDLLQSRSA